MDNLSNVQLQLQQYKVDGLLLVSPVNRRYATGFASSAGMVLITPNEGYFFTDSRYIEAARAQISGFTVEMTSRDDTATQKAVRVLKAERVRKLGFEERSLSYDEYRRYESALPAKLLPAQQMMDELRAVKSDEEIGYMLEAQRIAERALKEVLPLIREGTSEKELAAHLIYQMLKHGGEQSSFSPIVASGPNSSMPHAVPSDRRFCIGDFITLDFGTVFKGYNSDMTRTFALGEATDEMRHVYDTVLQAQQAALDIARAGLPGSELDAAARHVIERAGYGEYFGHGFGHGLGLEVHEDPGAQPVSRTPLPEGAVVSAEPGIYLPGRFGVRIEDVIRLKRDGYENLMTFPKELTILPL